MIKRQTSKIKIVSSLISCYFITLSNIFEYLHNCMKMVMLLCSPNPAIRLPYSIFKHPTHVTVLSLPTANLNIIIHRDYVDYPSRALLIFRREPL